MPVTYPRVSAAARQGYLLQYEVNPDYTREQLVLLAGSGAEREVRVGQLLGRITASGKMVVWAPGATDGSQTVAGVVLEDSDAPSGADGVVLALTRGPAIVRQEELDFGAATAGQITAAITTLAGLGVRVKAAA